MAADDDVQAAACMPKGFKRAGEIVNWRDQKDSSRQCRLSRNIHLGSWQDIVGDNLQHSKRPEQARFPW